MTELFSFSSAEDASAKLDSLGGYVNPGDVVALKGAAAHEVAVGPVHAGVIEPGHFRFQCMGEDVFNLQIFLGYQHRGVEEAIVAERAFLRALARELVAEPTGFVAGAFCLSARVFADAEPFYSPEAANDESPYLFAGLEASFFLT